MSNPFRESYKDQIADNIAQQICVMSENVGKVAAITAVGLGANKVIDTLTYRKKDWKSYLNPLEYFRSLVQLPASLLVAKSAEEQIGSYLHVGENIEKGRPVLRAFLRPIVRAAISSVLDELEKKQLLKLPEPTMWESLGEKIRGQIPNIIAKPTNSLIEFVKYPFQFIEAWKEKNLPETNPWKIAEKNAPQYGQKVVDAAGYAVEQVKNYPAIPGKLFDVCTDSIRMNPAIYGGVAIGLFLGFMGTRSIYNRISMRQSAKANAQNMVHIEFNVPAPVPTPEHVAGVQAQASAAVSQDNSPRKTALTG